ncbi:MAG: tetratricopeptide repeat protein, partial [Flammeovirgaceae bacterium]|nr:tetratricopeptide repeat protein [Flammeovirgaceae bacterium]MDW8288880.1 tetratricopeptide repeat protein [Flammeovirgaceae bacterium]
LTTKEFLKDNPTDLEMIFLEAVAENKLSIFADAASVLSKVVENPKITPQLKVSFYFTLGLIYKNMKEYTKAEEAFKKAGVGPFAFAARYEYDLVHKLKHNAGQDSDEDMQMSDEGGDEGDEGGR